MNGFYGKGFVGEGVNIDKDIVLKYVIYFIFFIYLKNFW